MTVKCAVRFCGGCNPRYDRGMLYQEISEECAGMSGADILFEYAREDEQYDIILVISGCHSRCASYIQYDFKKALIISDYDQKEHILSSLLEVKNELEKVL